MDNGDGLAALVVVIAGAMLSFFGIMIAHDWRNSLAKRRRTIAEAELMEAQAKAAREGRPTESQRLSVLVEER